MRTQPLAPLIIFKGQIAGSVLRHDQHLALHQVGERRRQFHIHHHRPGGFQAFGGGQNGSLAVAVRLGPFRGAAQTYSGRAIGTRGISWGAD